MVETMFPLFDSPKIAGEEPDFENRMHHRRSA